MISMKPLVQATLILPAMILLGCSSSRQQPVYAEVPGISPGAAVSPAGPVSAPPVSDESAGRGTGGETPELIVTPDESLTGSVVSVNDVGRFVVVRFPLGRLPARGATLYAYRQGLKVAELEVSGPQQDDHMVADIRSGECRVNDEVRDR